MELINKSITNITEITTDLLCVNLNKSKGIYT